MKQYSKLVLTALLALTSFTAYAGDFCFSPGRSCNVSSGGGSGACCDNNGYLFGYGGFAFSSEVTSRLLNPFTGPYPDGSGFYGEQEPPTEDWSLGGGYIVGAGAGVRSSFLCGSRFEIEGLYTENDVDRIFLPAFTAAASADGLFPGGPAGGFDLQGANATISTTALMVNFLKEVPVGCATAYFGGGLGIASTEVDFTFNNGARTFYGSDRDYALAHQFIVGADLPVSDCLSLFLQYKLFNAGDIEVQCPGAGRGFDKFAEFESFYRSHLVFGARFYY